VLLLILWGILLVSLKPGREPVDIKLPDVMEVTPGLAIVVLTFVTTILLWLTQPLHGLPSAVVALLPIAVFFAFNILDRADLKSMDWDVMILVAGGLTLGVGLKATGLSTCLVNLIPFDVMSTALLLGVIMAVVVLLSNFMSHTAASNLMMPIACSIAVLEPRIGAMAVALAASLAMSLPVSTPPNAMAFATGELKIREMAVHGTLVSLAGLTAVLALLMLCRPLILSR
jgi:sodium-dependent dicarboxylate transporter 2/3/5